MLRLIDDLAGAIWDLLKTALVGFCYFIAGIFIVGVPLMAISYLFIWIGQ